MEGVGESIRGYSTQDPVLSESNLDIIAFLGSIDQLFDPTPRSTDDG
jgi:hypothetical protein